jgi:hypothetical protein
VYKWSINAFPDPNTVSSHPLNRDNIKVRSQGHLAHHQRNDRSLVILCPGNLKAKSSECEAPLLPDNRVQGTILANNSAKACINHARCNTERKPYAIMPESVPFILPNTGNDRTREGQVLRTIFVYVYKRNNKIKNKTKDYFFKISVVF